jgi:hypothetical protein
MPPKKTKKEKSDEQTLRDVVREMAKPRLAESVRAAALADLAERNPSGHISVSEP